MIIKIAMLLFIIAAIFFHSKNDPTVTSPVINTHLGWLAIIISFGAALKGACFTYGGYQQTINFGGEVNDPVRTIPRAIIRGMLIVIALYLLVNTAYYYIIGFNALKHTNAIATLIASSLLGKPGEWIAALLLFLAVLAYVNVTLLSNPRVIAAMSKDGIFPKQFQQRNEKTGVYRIALSVFTLISLVILLFIDSFSKILSFSVFLDSLGMITAGLALFIFRKRKDHLEANIYKIKLYPFVPLLFIAGYLFVAIIIVVEEPNYGVTGLCTLAFFLLLYWLIYGKKHH